MNPLCYLDAFFLSLLLLCSIDVIRQANPLKHPAHAIGFGAMSIGAAGWILQDLSGVVPSWYALSFHAGLFIYASLSARALYLHNRRKDDNRYPETSSRTMRAAAEVVSEGQARRSSDRARPA